MWRLCSAQPSCTADCSEADLTLMGLGLHRLHAGQAPILLQCIHARCMRLRLISTIASAKQGLGYLTGDCAELSF